MQELENAIAELEAKLASLSYQLESPFVKPAEAAKPAIAYSNLPAEAAVSTSGYDNLPAHTLRIQRANMLGGALDDGGLEIEVFDDALLGQLQQ